MACAPLHRDKERGGLWFLRYCKNVVQSRRFCDSYLLGVAGGEEGVTMDGPGSPSLTGPGRCDPESIKSRALSCFL